MAYSSSMLSDISLVDCSANGEGVLAGQHLDEPDKKGDATESMLDRKTVEDLAETLLRGRFFLTALELHAELQEAGFDLPKLRQFFSNPANVDQKVKMEHSLCRSPSQQTFDSIEFDRLSDVNNTEQDRVAVLEYELRKAKETIKRLRENVTVQTTSVSEESAAEVPANNNNGASATKTVVEESNTGPPRPMEVLERRAINFLVHEFVLKNGNKMTAVTFSEENTDQDFDDWDDVGLNTARPPSLLQLYRRYLHYRPTAASNAVVTSKQDAETNTVNDFKQPDAAEKVKTESLCQKIDELEQKLRKSKQDAEREISRLMFENERVNEELKRLKKTAALAATGGIGGALRPDVSTYSVASTTGALDDSDQNTLQQEPEAPCLKVKAEPCQHFPPPLISKILALVDHRLHAASYSNQEQQMPSLSALTAGTIGRVYEELEKMRSSFSPYDCTLSWQFYKSVKKLISANQLEEVVPFLVWLLLRTTGDQREDITQELLSLFGSRCELKHTKLIVSALLCYADLANIQEVQSHLLAVAWEQINDRDSSRRLAVAYLCGPLACYLEPQIRSSLLFSILNQLVAEDKDTTVRLAALDSLVQVLVYLDDYDKLVQLTDLYISIVNKDTDEKMIKRAQTVYLPMLLLWSSHNLSSFLQVIQTVFKQIQSSLTGCPTMSSESLHRAMVGFYNTLPVIVHRCLTSISSFSLSSTVKDSWHADPVKLPRVESEFFDWSSLEPDQLKLKKLLEKFDSHVFECIERAKLEGADNFVNNVSVLNLSQPFGSVCQEIFPLLVQLSTTISYSAQPELSMLIRITCFFAETFGPTVCTNLLAPLFVQQVLSVSEKLGMALVKSEHSLAQSGFVAVYCALLGSSPLRDEISPILLDCVVVLSTSQKRLDPILTAFSMLAQPQVQVLLSVVWDCVVHPLPAVRSSAANLCKHLISLVDTSVLSSRLFSALVTLSNDAQLSVRLATLAPLVALLTQTENAQLLEKVYFQLQQVLDDPQCANDSTAHIRTIELFTQIIPNVDAKFRDEFILQRFAVMAAQNNHCQDKSVRQSIAEALLNAYNTANCCYIPPETIRRLISPALKCIAIDLQTLGLKGDEEKLAKLIKEVESKLTGSGHPLLSSQISTPASSSTIPQKDRTVSVTSLNATTTSNVGFAQASPSAAFGSIMASPSAVAAAEAAKSKLAKFKQQSKTFFNK